MGFFKDLFSKETKTKILKGVEQSAKQGAINSLLGMTDSEEDIFPQEFNGTFSNVTNTSKGILNNNSQLSSYDLSKSNDKITFKHNPKLVLNNSYTSDLSFNIPNWGYEDFINERTIFQKGLGSMFNEPAWFYFKIFFEFENPYGLLGHSNYDKDEIQTNYIHLGNCAYKYLRLLNTGGSKTKYVSDYIDDRINALIKFSNLLKYISSSAPWFFKSIKNLNSVNVFNEFTKEKTIEIECNPDAIDIRLQSLLDLYKYACYDDIKQVEIIPENLRKFNMSIVVFQSPIKALHTAVKANSMKFGYKTLNPAGDNDWSNVMSYKIYHLYNCEIMVDSFQSVIASDMNNEKPFNISPIIKIKFDRLYTHTMNEIFGAMWGSDGFSYNANIDKYDTSTKNRVKALAEAITSNTGGKSLVEASEAITHNFHANSNLLTNASMDLLTKTLFNTSLSSDYELGTLYGDYGVGSQYFKEKIQNIKNGSLNLKYKGSAIELYNSMQNKTAYDLNNTKNNLINTLSYRWGKHIK